MEMDLLLVLVLCSLSVTMAAMQPLATKEVASTVNLQARGNSTARNAVDLLSASGNSTARTAADLLPAPGNSTARTATNLLQATNKRTSRTAVHCTDAINMHRNASSRPLTREKRQQMGFLHIGRSSKAAISGDEPKLRHLFQHDRRSSRTRKPQPTAKETN